MFEKEEVGDVVKHGSIDSERVERAVREILYAVGEDPTRPGLVNTPSRVAQMYSEVFSGLFVDPIDALDGVFNEDYDSIVLLKDINFASICEHHLIPFHGIAHVGYIPNGELLGLSKIVRMINVLSRRPQIQERLTNQVADTLLDKLQPQGVAVFMQAEHSCMSLRGVKNVGSKVVTCVTRGIFDSSPEIENRFLSMIQENS